MWILSQVSAYFCSDGVQHDDHLCVFLLAQQVQLKIEMAASFANAAVLILTDQDERGEKDRFERNDEREESKRKRIDMAHAWNYIQKNPTAEPDNVNPDKRHAAAELRNLLGQAISGCPLFSGRFFKSRYGLDILLCQLLGR